MKIWYSPLWFFLCVLLASCDSNRIYEENKAIDGGSWSIDNKISFEAEIKDTMRPVNMYINLRNGGEYQYSNLFMFVTTIFPNGKQIVDTVECVLAGSKGWHGNGLGGVWSHQILYKRNVRFPIKGNYIVEFEQAQRFGEQAYIPDLESIFDVGLRIEFFN